jgi:VWFA-related protein
MVRTLFLRRFAAAWLAAGLVLAAGTTPGLPQEKTFHESTGVSLVQVPVYVTGRDGKPIRGLTAGNFILEDEGVRQKIEALDVVDLQRKRLEPGELPTIPAAARRHFLLLFDLSFASPNEIAHSRQAALQFIANGLDPEDLAAVATVSAEQGIRLLLTFTSDRRQLTAAIRSIDLPNPTDQVRDPLAFAFKIPGDPNNAKFFVSEEFQSRNQADIVANAKLYSMIAQKTADQFSISRVERQLGGMAALGSALDAVDGRKTIVYFSEGFDARLLVGDTTRSAEDNQSSNEAMLHGQFWQIDVDKRYTNTPLQGVLSQTLSLFRRSDCTVYPIDIAGLQTSQDAQFGDSYRRGEESLFQIANETGGFVIKNANDFGKQLDRIAEETSLTYILSFEPTRTLGAGRFHRLKVRVRGVKAARVSARAGYYESKTFGTMSPLERALAAADVITHEKRETDFPMEVVGIPVAGHPLSTVPILLEMPGKALLAGTPPDGRLILEIYVYVTDTRGQLADYFSRTMSIDLALQGETLRNGRLTYYGVCHLLPGQYRIRAFVRNQQDGRFAFRAAPLHVPAWDGEKVWAYPPLFLAGKRPGLSLKDAGREAHNAPDPLEFGGNAFVPLLDPVIGTGTESQICLMFYQLGAERGPNPFNVAATIVDPSGQDRGPANIVLLGRSRPGPEGLVKLLIRFRASDLPPGPYSLRFVLRDADGGAPFAVTEAPFRISRGA